MPCQYHHETHYCPLYLASHYPRGGGCVTDSGPFGGCKVALGKMNYAKAVAAFEAAHPGACQLQAQRELEERGPPLWGMQ